MTICCQMSVPFQKAHTKPENIQKQYYPKKSCTFPPEQHEFTQRSLAPLTPINGRPFFRHIGLVAEVRSSYPPYPPGRLQVVAPNGLTRREKHRAERSTSECTMVLKAPCQYVLSTIQPLVIRRRSKRQNTAWAIESELPFGRYNYYYTHDLYQVARSCKRTHIYDVPPSIVFQHTSIITIPYLAFRESVLSSPTYVYRAIQYCVMKPVIPRTSYVCHTIMWNKLGTHSYTRIRIRCHLEQDNKM